MRANEDSPTMSATKMFTRDSSFWRHEAYVDILYGPRTRKRQSTVWWSKAAIFNAFSRRICRAHVLLTTDGTQSLSSAIKSIFVQPWNHYTVQFSSVY